MERRSFERFKSPLPTQSPAYFPIEFFVLRPICINHKAAARSICFHWQIQGGARLAPHMKHQIVGQGRREHEWCAFCRQHQRIALQAMHSPGIDRP